jgi:hypothetical protein
MYLWLEGDLNRALSPEPPTFHLISALVIGQRDGLWRRKLPILFVVCVYS